MLTSLIVAVISTFFGLIIFIVATTHMGLDFFKQVESLNKNVCKIPKVYTFELGYSFFMVLGSMFLAQICLLPWSQIIVAGIRSF